MSGRYPWNHNTSGDIADGSNPQYETPGGAQLKADEAREQAIEVSAAALAMHRAIGDDEHPLATVTEAGFMSAADKAKSDSVQTGAEVNQNAFANINGLVAANESDQVSFDQGTGIAITNDPVTKKIKFTATGTSTPGPHAESHLTGGNDAIPLATTTADGLAPSTLISEVTNSRTSSVTGTGYPTLKARLDANDTDFRKEVSRVPGVNVKDFGVVGGGTVDDTAAFQAAINAVKGQGGILYVPKGIYKITNTLDINASITIVGEGWSMRDGTTILAFSMDDKSVRPAIKVRNTECVNISGLYLLNRGTVLHDGLCVDGENGGANNELNSFVHVENTIANGFRYNFKVAHTWVVSFRDCYAGKGTYGWFVQGGTITTLLLDHCYTERQTLRAFYINGAYYSTLLSCATDFAPIGYKFSNAQNVVMTGCAAEECINTGIDIDGSTVIIDGFVSVNNGVGSDNNFATMLNAISSHVSARGFSEISAPAGTTKFSSVSLGSDVTGEYVATNKEKLGLFYPKNGKFIFNGQSFSNGVPVSIGWKSTDIGRVVYVDAPVQAGTSPNRYVIFGYQRLTAGNGNVLGTDWLPLRALTGN